MASAFADIKSFATKHKAIAIGAGIVIAFILYQVYKQNQGSSSTASHNQQSAHGYTVVNEYYQSAPQGSKPGHPVPHQPVPGGQPTGDVPHQPIPQPPSQGSGGIVPKSSLPPTPWQFGQLFTWQGVTYTIGAGGGGRLWGVPGTNWNLADWNRVPIGPGGKVLLYDPAQSS